MSLPRFSLVMVSVVLLATAWNRAALGQAAPSSEAVLEAIAPNGMPSVPETPSVAAAIQLSVQGLCLTTRQGSTGDWSRQLGRRLASDEQLRVGAMTDYLVSQVQSELCSNRQIADLLPNSCAPLEAANRLILLRDRLADDTVFLAQKLGGSNRILAAALEALGHGGRYQDFLLALVATSGATSKLGLKDDLCSSGRDLSGLLGNAASDDIDRVLVVLVALEQERQSVVNSLEMQRARAVAILAQLKDQTTESFVAQLTPAQNKALDELLTTLQRAQSDRSSAGWRHFLMAIASAMVVTQGTDPGVVPTLRFLEAMERGDLLAALQPFMKNSTEIGAATLGRTIEWIERIVRFIKARDDGGRFRVLRSTALGLGSWSDQVILDGNVGAMAVSGGNYRISGDLSLGWQAANYGVLLSGNVRSFEETTSRTFETQDRYQGYLEAFFATDGDKPWRFDGRLVTGFADFTAYQFVANAQYDEISWLGRAAVLAGARYEGSRIGGGIWLGGGGQYESYDALDLRSGTQELRTTLGVQGQGRFRLRYSLWPQFLSLRARVDASTFSISRQQAVTDFSNGAVVAKRTLWRELEVSGRAYVDLEVVRLFGFTPGLAGGVDYLKRTANGQNVAMVAPYFGAGVRREWF